MRARSSDNFTTGDLPAIVALCREHGLKSYLTLNIVLFDEEINEMRKLLAAAASAGVTAVIATDQAAIMAASEAGMEIHLSTQLNISNAGSLKFYSQWADVAVLSRELNLEQVRKIYDSIISDEIQVVVEYVYKMQYLHVASGTGTLPTASVKIGTPDGVKQAAACVDGPVDAAYQAIR